jgi:hypothetical protein
MTAELFTQLSEELTGGRSDVEPTRMFGAIGLKTHGKTFAMLVKGRRLMQEWIRLTAPTDPTTCRTLIAEALAFVAAVVASSGRG